MASDLRRSRFGAMGSIVLIAGFAGIAAPAGQVDVERRVSISTAAPLPDALDSAPTGGVAGPCPATTCGGVGCSMTQSIDQLTNGGNQIACGTVGVGTTENGWARCYNRAQEGMPPGNIQIDLVTFGVQQATANGINVNVNLYLDNDFCPPGQPGADAQLLASVPLVVNVADAGTLMTADFTGLGPIWPPGTDLVVEIEQVDDGLNAQPTFSFRPGSNAGGQCGPSYIRAFDCGFPGWVDMAALGFPNAHLIQVVATSTPSAPAQEDNLTTCGFPNGLLFGGPEIPPIPPDFFGPGSQPFFGSIQYEGVPLSPSTFGSVDTIVRRRSAPLLPSDPPGSIGTVPIEIVALSLVSVNPITVNYSGGPPIQWDVTINLSIVPSPQGSVTAVKQHHNGGTFDAILPVRPRFTFSQVGPPYDVRVLDTGEVGLPPIQFTIDEAPWVHDANPLLPLIQPAENFVPGIFETIPGDLNSQVETPFTAASPLETVTHTVCPGTVKVGRCEVTSNVIPRNQSACTTTVNGDGTKNVRVTFEMNSSFRDNVSCCEYRQKVKGEFTYNGKVLEHTMNPGVILDKDELREDGFGVPTPAGSNANYGHRNAADAPNNPAHDHYGAPANRGAGSNYHGTDAPGMSNIPAGRTYNIDLSFEGKIIDTCNGTDVRTHTWDVDCAGTASGTGGPLVEVITETVINGRNGLLVVALYPGNELTVDAALANFFGEVPIDSSEVDVDVTGLLPTDVPDPGALPETSVGGAMAHALFDFDYPPGSPDPVHVSLTYGPETQEFDVDLPAVPCPWDLDGNGNVGITDLLILLANWGNPYGINDLLDLLAAWGPC